MGNRMDSNVFAAEIWQLTLHVVKYGVALHSWEEISCLGTALTNYSHLFFNCTPILSILDTIHICSPVTNLYCSVYPLPSLPIPQMLAQLTRTTNHRAKNPSFFVLKSWLHWNNEILHGVLSGGGIHTIIIELHQVNSSPFNFIII